MTSQGYRVGGALVFWTLSEWTELDKLHDRLTELGYGECTPERRPAAAALKSALDAVMGTKEILIRPLADRDGFTVIKETRGAVSNAYDTLLSARLMYNDEKGKERKVDRISYDPWGARCGEITEMYNRHLGLLPASAVADTLVKIVGKMGGTALRPKGGVYWIGNHCVDRWSELSTAVEHCGEGKFHKLYIMRQVMDADAMRAIRDSIEQELLGEARRIHDEVLAGELGARALDARRAYLGTLKEKLSDYETILGQSLGHIADALDKSIVAESAAALLAAASDPS